jgi:hypothetical protein
MNLIVNLDECASPAAGSFSSSWQPCYHFLAIGEIAFRREVFGLEVFGLMSFHEIGVEGIYATACRIDDIYVALIMLQPQS